MSVGSSNPTYGKAKIGCITVKLFDKMIKMLANVDEAARYEALYNMLVIMKEEDDLSVLQAPIDKS